MPPKSEKQRRFMGAVAAGKVKGVAPSVGKEYLAEDPGGKLPKTAKKTEKKKKA